MLRKKAIILNCLLIFSFSLVSFNAFNNNDNNINNLEPSQYQNHPNSMMALESSMNK